MKAVWKWIIGVVVALVVVGVIVMGVWFVASRVGAMHRITGVVPPQTNPMPYGRNPDGDRQGPGWMMPYGGNGPMMRGRGFGFGMLPFMGILRFFFGLGLLALVIAGIIWLVRSLERRPVVNAAPPASATAAPAGAAETTHACPNCGQPVQNGFAFCPKCGTKQ